VLNHGKEPESQPSTGYGLISGDFSYLEEEKVKKDIGQDGSKLDHDQQ
jgi:hypothetical protein